MRTGSLNETAFSTIVVWPPPLRQKTASSNPDGGGKLVHCNNLAGATLLK